jgi:hypothetical protein
MNVLAYMKYPNMIDAATKGVALGSKIAQLPREAQETATEMAMNKLNQAKIKSIQDRAKAIMADDYSQKGGENQRSLDLNQLYMLSGVGSSGGQPSMSATAPFEMARSLGILGSGGYTPDTSSRTAVPAAPSYDTSQTTDYPAEIGGY